MSTPLKLCSALTWMIPALMLTAGLILMAIKIVADSEPGAIPVIMVITSLVWLIVFKRKRRPLS